MSVSCEDSNIKIWSIKTIVCIFDLKNIYENGSILSACFLYDNNQNYIVSSNYKDSLYPIKIFDLEKKLVKEIIDSKDMIWKVDSYYDKQLSQNFIITCSYGYEKSYNFNENSLYQKYQENNDSFPHFDFIIKSNNKETKIIESSEEGCIRIWNFHTGELLKKVILNECL